MHSLGFDLFGALFIALLALLLLLFGRRYSLRLRQVGAQRQNITPTPSRLLKPRTPHDCPSCRAAPAPSPCFPVSRHLSPHQRLTLSVPGRKSKAAEGGLNAFPPTALPVPTLPVLTLALPTLPSMPSSVTAFMALTVLMERPSVSRRFVVRRVAPRLPPGVTLPSIASRPRQSVWVRCWLPWRRGYQWAPLPVYSVIERAPSPPG